MANSALAPEIEQIAGRPRLSFLEGMRGAAAMYVMLHHMSRQSWPGAGFIGSVPPVRYQKLITIPLTYGHYAVDLFIVLSGFCLMLPVVRAGGKLRGGTKDFLLRRARRILPPYYAALLISLILIYLFINRQTGTPWDHCVPVTRAGLLAHLFMVHDFYGAHLDVWKQIDHPLWSVALEFQIYLLFPPLIWLWNRVGGVAATMLAIFGIIVAHVGFHFSPIKILCFDFTALFCVGVAACAVATSTEAPWTTIRRLVPWRTATFLSLIALAGLNHLAEKHASLGDYLDPMVGLFCALLLITVTIRPHSVLRNIFQRKPIVFVGTFSYSLYLIHAPLIQLIWQYGLKPLDVGRVGAFFALLTVGSALILLISYGFFVVCERPFIAAGHRKPRSELPAIPAV